MELNVNSSVVETDYDENTPLLWVLRDSLGLKGTKISCGAGICGACTVLLDGRAIRSCITPIAVVKDRKITTIEGLSDDLSHPLQQSWIEHDVPQCGYCQPGFIMAAAGLLADNPTPNEQEVENRVSNICRCGTYDRIRKAITDAAENINADKV